MIKIGKAYIWEVHNGQLKEILVGNLIVEISNTRFFSDETDVLISPEGEQVIKPVEKEVKKVVRKEETIEQSTKPTPGRIIARIKKKPIEQNIYNEIMNKNAVDNQPLIRETIWKYKPHLTKKTVNAYGYAYNSYCKKYLSIIKGQASHTTTAKPKRKMTPRKQLGGAVGKGKKYIIREVPLKELREVPNLTKAKAKKVLRNYYSCQTPTLAVVAQDYLDYLKQHPSTYQIGKKLAQKHEHDNDIKGPVIGTINKMKVHKHIYEEIIAVKDDMDKSLGIIKKYYPHIGTLTTRAYRINYLAFRIKNRNNNNR